MQIKRIQIKYFMKNVCGKGDNYYYESNTNMVIADVYTLLSIPLEMHMQTVMF